MIKLESIHVEEVRGIRKLDLDFGRENFAISGPNGSGKSGIIDAIEFGLTGQMGRLTGRGTKGLSVGQHGPHVDKVDFPAAAFVTLKVFLTELNKSVKITRLVSAPKKPTIEPDEQAVRSVLAEIAEHPEITLSRREILRFILVEPTKRSDEIQALLKLDEIGLARNVLNTTLNKLNTAQTAAATQVQTKRNTLQLHLQIPGIKPDAILEAANKRRIVLNLPPILVLTKDTKLDEGLVTGAGAPDFNKESALRDVAALSDAAGKSSDLGKTEAAAIIADLAALESDPTLLVALQQRALVERGLSLVDKAQCPLCDTAWPDINHLKQHLNAKLAKSNDAKKVQEALVQNAGLISNKITAFTALQTPIVQLATVMGEKEFAELLTLWKSDLENFKTNLTTVDKIRKMKARFEDSWLAKPGAFVPGLAALNEKLKAKPDQSATIDAQTFLTTAQLRLGDLREASKTKEAAEAAKATAKVAYDAYCAIQEAELNSLYEEVQQDFSTFYRALNGQDESKFTARFTPTAGSLGFDVNFYERGLYPPAAYHSEGHQDGMGVCLYLALMKRLFGNRFTLSLLDDVVMSVDSGHRYEFCKLLKSRFPDTQFIITTHDRLWAEQMKSAGLVTGKTSIVFFSWTIETGPLVQSNDEIWDEIAGALSKGKVDSAAFALRHHLEYAMRLLADQLGARPQFRADGSHEFDEMMSSVLKRAKDLWEKAAKAAKSWGKSNDENIANEKKDFLSTCNAAMRAEQWTVNKAVHYNEWATFDKNDFVPIVAAFKELMECFRCKQCDSWIYVLPRMSPQTVRCNCATISFNLIPK
jgi:recombinational DNA repair ATPase RecF